jgi:sorbitol-specific phosphotransferase system component IIBC
MIDLFHHFYEDDGSFLHNFIADSLNYLNEQVKEIEVKVVEVKEAEVTEAKVKEAEVTEAKVKEAKVKENEGEEVVISKYKKAIKILVNIFLIVHFVDFIIWYNREK